VATFHVRARRIDRAAFGVAINAGRKGAIFYMPKTCCLSRDATGKKELVENE